MKKLLAIILLVCSFSLLLCSCGKENVGSAEFTFSDSASDSDIIRNDDMYEARPLWEGILYAAYKTGADASSSEFCAMALSYTLSHYEYGERTETHSDKLLENVTVTRSELASLSNTMSFESLPTDEELSAYFDINGDTFTLKEISFDAAEYDVLSIIISKTSAVTAITANGNTTTLTMRFEVDENSPMGIKINSFEKTGE